MIQEPTWPSGKLVAITKSDTTVHNPAIRQIYVGTAGDVVVEDVSGTTVTFKNVVAGSTLGPFFVSKVKLATTAADMVGFV